MFKKINKKTKFTFFKKIFNKMDYKDYDKKVNQKEVEDFLLLTTMYNFDEAGKSNKWQNPQNLNDIYHSIDDIEIFNNNEEDWNFNLHEDLDIYNQKEKNIKNSINRSYKGIHIWNDNKNMKFLLLFVTSIGFSGGMLGIFICQYLLPAIC